MKYNSIRDKVKAYYETQQLPPEKVERLKSMILDAGESKETAKQPSLLLRNIVDFINSLRPRLVAAMATALALMVMVNLGGLYYWHGSSESMVNTSIAREIAMNHIKNLESEFQTSSITALRAVMPNLDFEPFSPKIVEQMGLVLHGARYCSIQGYLAIQLNLSDASGKRHSLYQAPCLPPLQKIKRLQVYSGDVQITMWNEGGIFMGLAN